MDSINRKSGHSAMSRMAILNSHFSPSQTMQKAAVMINIDGEEYQEVIEHMPFKKVSFIATRKLF